MSKTSDTPSSAGGLALLPCPLQSLEKLRFDGVGAGVDLLGPRIPHTLRLFEVEVDLLLVGQVEVDGAEDLLQGEDREGAPDRLGRRSPFQRGSTGAVRLTFIGRSGGKNSETEEVELDVARKTGSVRRLGQIFFSAGGRRVTVRITDDMREPEQLLAKMSVTRSKYASVAEPPPGA